MPRGNDAAEASAELAEKYNSQGNAEDLIRANRLRMSTELRAAQGKKVVREISDEDELADIAKAAGEDDPVVAAAERGGDGDIVYVVEDGRGQHKGLLSKKSKAKPKAKKNEDLSPAELAEKTQAEADEAAVKAATAAREAEEARIEDEIKLEKASAREAEKVAKEAKAKADKEAEEASKESAKAAKATAKAAEEQAEREAAARAAATKQAADAQSAQAPTPEEG